jgi:hypothetical protein
MLDSEGCRLRAQLVAKLANDTLNPRLQSLLFDMATVWLKISKELAHSGARLDAALRLPPKDQAEDAGAPSAH